MLSTNCGTILYSTFSLSFIMPFLPRFSRIYFLFIHKCRIFLSHVSFLPDNNEIYFLFCFYHFLLSIFIWSSVYFVSSLFYCVMYSVLPTQTELHHFLHNVNSITFSHVTPLQIVMGLATLLAFLHLLAPVRHHEPHECQFSFECFLRNDTLSNWNYPTDLLLIQICDIVEILRLICAVHLTIHKNNT